MKYIFLRKENKFDEKRTALTPKDIHRLIQNDWILYIQKSEDRIYSDQEYEKYGGILTDKNWWEMECDDKYSIFFILGLKELSHDELKRLNHHIHIYFSHSMKGQKDAEKILYAFSHSGSILYDFEYFKDPYQKNKRFLSFGYYAGFIGAFLAIYQHETRNLKKNMPHIRKNFTQFMQIFHSYTLHYPTIALIGPDGNCGQGALMYLQQHGIPIDKIKMFRKKDSKKELLKYDVVINCISLDESYDEIWFQHDMNYYKYMVICDISCDYTKPNHPIPIYTESTTFDNPVYSYSPYVDIIAIDHLPSLLPKDSSDYFSSKCVELLEQYLEDPHEIWKDTREKYYHSIRYS